MKLKRKLCPTTANTESVIHLHYYYDHQRLQLKPVTQPVTLKGSGVIRRTCVICSKEYYCQRARGPAEFQLPECAPTPQRGSIPSSVPGVTRSSWPRGLEVSSAVRPAGRVTAELGKLDFTENEDHASSPCGSGSTRTTMSGVFCVRLEVHCWNCGTIQQLDLT